jgi:hypothetical protein
MKKINYILEEVCRNQTVSADGCRSISFENAGEVDAKLDNVLMFDVDDPVRVFKNHGDDIIVKNFNISFLADADPHKIKKVLVIKEFVLK